MKQKKNLLTIVLVIGLVLVLLGSFAAQIFNTGFYSVKVERIYFDTESGTLSGLLYLPKGADASNPRPTIVTTHGYLNSAEMQDAPAIELSRRGYVVLALDMYDHGHSKGNAEHTGGFMNFWPTSIFDAAAYMYQQPYVQKDAEGNGVIAVSGHSMGGFSSTMALYYDELAYAQTGVRMICAGLSAGSDYSYTAWLGLDVDTGVANFGGRTIGKICAQYDEFFFIADDAKDGTVVKKDYVSTTPGRTILEQENPSANTWYATSDGGMRIIYEPHETHPWNHFSKTTTGYMIDFYTKAFEKYDTTGIKSISSGSQIWMFKEAFECVALIGFLVVIAALAALLLKVPFLKLAKSGEPTVTAPASNLTQKVGKLSLFLSTMMIPAIIFPTVYGGSFTAEPMRWIGFFALISGILAIAAIVMSLLSKDEGKKTVLISSVVVLVASAALFYLTRKNLFADGKVFQAGVPSSIATWALISAFISVIIMTAVHLFSGKKGLGVYGIQAKPISVVASFCIAVIVSVAAYALLFLVDALFTTDFRIWTFAFKTFEASAIPAALKYMPFFFIYYFVSAAAAVSNSSSEKLQGVKGYVVACLTNMGGILLWLILQYGLLFATGKAFYTGEALSGILLIALVPTLIAATCYAKYLYKKTGNVYTAAFLNAIVMTMMTVANTTVYWQV